MEKWTETERRAMHVIQDYTYNNFFIKTITLWGHKACQRLRKFDDDEVVDLGCGTGDHFPFIRRGKIIGIDLNKDRLSIARKRYSQAEILYEDIFNLSFKSNSIRSIVSIGTLEHLDPLSEALDSIHRVLAPGGEFVFCIPTEGFFYRLGRILITKPYVEKMTGVDYNRLIQKEHLNSPYDILREIKKYFLLNRLTGIPLPWPTVKFNILIAGRCLKSGSGGNRLR